MILVFVLFWIIVGWALYDGEMYAKEAAIWIAIWVGCLAGFLLLPAQGMICLAAMALVDVILIIRQFGGDIRRG